MMILDNRVCGALCRPFLFHSVIGFVGVVAVVVVTHSIVYKLNCIKVETIAVYIY